MTEPFQDDVQFLNWRANSKSGFIVSFRVDDEDQAKLFFDGLDGVRGALAFVVEEDGA